MKKHNGNTNQRRFEWLSGGHGLIACYTFDFTEQLNADGVWGTDMDFKMTGAHFSRRRGGQFSRTLVLELTGSTVLTTALSSTLESNATTFETLVQVRS